MLPSPSVPFYQTRTMKKKNAKLQCKAQEATIMSDCEIPIQIHFLHGQITRWPAKNGDEEDMAVDAPQRMSIISFRILKQ